MIGHLRGQLMESSTDVVLIDVQGVGYEVRIPLSTYYELEKLDDGHEVSLRIHTHVREDTLQLFGFWTLLERRLFEKLIAVNGIGPKLAQTILSGMVADELIQALSSGDVKRLTTIPGVGKRTAERMVVDLKDKVMDLGTDLPTASAPATPTPGENDLVLALVNLGYKKAAAEKAALQTLRQTPDGSFAEQLRATLRLLSRV